MGTAEVNTPGPTIVPIAERQLTLVSTLLPLANRFCDSPIEELDSRTPKGRGKRGRSAALQPTNDLSNFTETRSSVSPQ